MKNDNFYNKYKIYKKKYKKIKGLCTKYLIIDSSQITEPDDINSFCTEIYTVDSSINIFLRNFQKSEEVGFFNGKCFLYMIRQMTDVELDIFSYDFNPEYPAIPFLNRFAMFDNICSAKILKPIFEDILINFNRNNVNVLSSKSNAALTIILEHCVVRIYNNDIFNRKIKNLLPIVISAENSENNYFEVIHKVYDTEFYVVVASEKVIPVKVTGPTGLVINPELTGIFSLETAYEHITNALSILHHANITHNDVRLDNIGYRESDGKYILFDFDMVQHKSTRHQIIDDRPDFNI
jgi:hypothetical protein